MEKTYLEILAQNDFLASREYVNPKDILVEQNEYEDDVEAEDHHEDEIEDQKDFQKFGGSHQHASIGKEIEPSNRSKSHPLYDKSVRTHVVNVDSRFRRDPLDPSTDFTFQLLKRMKNIISVRISSIEFPNVYYTFSKTRGNISFTYFTTTNNVEKEYIVTIPEGNYTPDELAATLTSLMNGFTVKFNFPGTSSTNPINTGKMTFQNSIPFRLVFNSGNFLSFQSRQFDRTIGDNLGFTKLPPQGYIAQLNSFTTSSLGTTTTKSGTIITQLTSQQPIGYSVTGESLVDTIDNNYIFLTLDPDWKVVTNQTLDKNIHHSFAKIIINIPKGDVLYDNGANTLTKEFFFQQPTDILQFPVKVTDPYDQPINLNGMDFSFSLEFKEVLNQELYETMRS